MIIATTDQIEAKPIKEVLGMVKGNTVRARHIGKDLMAALRNIVGGEVTEYSRLMAESRKQAINRMTESAKEMGANAIVGVRFVTSMIATGASEILAYGTAVVLEDAQ